MSTESPTILVIVGITGDLSQRKLLPAIEKLGKAGMLPEQFYIVGITRRDVSVEEVAGTHAFIKKHLHMYQMDLDDPDEYAALEKHLKHIEHSCDQEAQRLFYLSVPPQVSQPVIRLLGEAGMCQKSGTKLLLEKPFGSDLASAEGLIEHIHEYFDEDQVYRIDHYLAKEMAQNILVFRSGNSLFKRTWNKDFIERIEIIAAESIGIEGRAVFYEQTGALRDIVQSHLLQLAALTLMEVPTKQAWGEVPKRRLDALRSLTPADPAKAVRGQYQGYREEVQAPHTTTETFVSVTLSSTDKRWEGVPITLTTGKSLNDKCTEVRIHYRQEDAGEANELLLQIQPHEGIELGLWSKQPGYGKDMERVRLHFDYHNQSSDLPDAYEQVFLDAISSDHSLFTSSEEVLASWRILAPLQHHWSMTADDLVVYRPGSTPESVLSLDKK